jgi:hypothetical protein
MWEGKLKSVTEITTLLCVRSERTYLANELTGASPKADMPHYVAGKSAFSAASVFVDQDGARLIADVSDLAGGKATATAWRRRRLHRLRTTW